MKQQTYIVSAILTIIASTLSFGQVGINTENPLGIFHIDVQKNNPTAGVPSTTEQHDDFIVSSDGKVGIGITTPDSKLHIVTPSGAGFQLQDGSQGVGKVLVSDSEGKASWNTSIAITPAVLGTLNVNEKIASTNTLIGSNLTLTKGKWLVNVGLLLRSAQASDEFNNLWVRTTFSSSNVTMSNSGFNFLASKLISTWGSSTLQAGDYVQGRMSFMSGVIPLEVTSDTPLTLYLWFAECTPGLQGSPVVTVGDNGENYLFATPMN